LFIFTNRAKKLYRWVKNGRGSSLSGWAYLILTPFPLWMIAENLSHEFVGLFREQNASGRQRRAHHNLNYLFLTEWVPSHQGSPCRLFSPYGTGRIFFGSSPTQRGAKDFGRELTHVIEGQDIVPDFQATAVSLEGILGKSNHYT
jgi:hypothetical protein